MKPNILILGLFVILAASCRSNGDSRPNIVIIFTDDQGYGDLGCFGSETIRTPHIDRMAAGGMTFTDFHVAASVCSPSRAALLTGCYPVRVGIPGVLFPDGAWGSNPDTGLNPDEELIPELLKEKGYATAMAGKWHLGHKEMFLPLQQGFDCYFGIPYSNDMNRGNLPLMQDNDVVEIEPDQALLTNRYTGFSVDFIRSRAGRSPFFLYLAHTMPHIPIDASEAFKGKSPGGLYADVIGEIDWSVGEILKTLEEEDIRHNTLVIFTSDNGPWLSYGNHGGSAGLLRGGKFDIFEGGFRVPCIMSWPGVIEPGSVSHQPVTSMDILPTLCDISGTSLPERKIDGISILPLLRGNQMPSLDDRLFYYYSGQSPRAVRQGPWKYILPHTFGMVAVPGIDGENGTTVQADQPETLYNLDEDIGETDNVIGDHPETSSMLRDSLVTFETILHSEARPAGMAEE